MSRTYDEPARSKGFDVLLMFFRCPMSDVVSSHARIATHGPARATSDIGHQTSDIGHKTYLKRFPADPWRQMADHISIPGLNGISGEPPRQGQGQRQRSKPGAALERKPGTPPPAEELTEPPANDPTTALVQALDRLRATHELRPAEAELLRAVRGMRYYQEESRHDLPFVDDPEASDGGLPPDQIG